MILLDAQGPRLASLRSCRRCRSRSRASRGPPTTESSAKGQHPGSPLAWSPKRHAPRREGAPDGEGRRQALERQSPCRRELDLHVENGEELQNSLSHRLYAARRVQRHILVSPLRNSGTKRISSAGLRPRTFLKRRRDSTLWARVIRVPTRVGLEVVVVLPFIVRIALVDVGRACDFELSTGHMWQVNGSREAQVLCIACHQAGHNHRFKPIGKTIKS